MNKMSNAAPDRLRVLQFGEGNFLRGFIDWMFQNIQNQGIQKVDVTVAVPIPGKKDHPWIDQNCDYILVTRGLVDGKVIDQYEKVTVIDRIVGCYEEYDAFLAAATDPALRLIVSNTTEAGITYVSSDRPTMRPPTSFPAKLTVLLHTRFRAGLPGVIILPCELIENNGGTLKAIILRYASDWGYEPAFLEWLEKECIFLSSLVDRIVTGHPRSEEVRRQLEKAIGHEDPLLDIVEPYHLLVLEPVADDPASCITRLQKELPFTEAGLNVIWTDDLTPYRTRKVRILNGAHTGTALAARLSGLTTVEEMMKDPAFSVFVEQLLHREVLPTIDLPQEELVAYTDAVKERFLNPYLDHQLTSIALNSVSKWRTRLLPTLKDRAGADSPLLHFSLSALIAYYLCGMGQDAAEILDFFTSLKEKPCDTIARAVLSRSDFWGEDLTLLPGLLPAVTADLTKIQQEGTRKALQDVLQNIV